MALLRINIDLAFPMPLSSTVQTRLNALKAEIVKAKAYAVVINAGQPNEEATVRAGYHVCRHDEGLPCEAEQEV